MINSYEVKSKFSINRENQICWGILPIFLFGSQEIGSNSVSFSMIFEAQQSEIFRSRFHSLSSKILKIPEFNLVINSPISRLLKGGSRALIPIPKHIPIITPTIVNSNSKFVFIHARHDALDTMI